MRLWAGMVTGGAGNPSGGCRGGTHADLITWWASAWLVKKKDTHTKTHSTKPSSRRQRQAWRGNTDTVWKNLIALCVFWRFCTHPPNRCRSTWQQPLRLCNGNPWAGPRTWLLCRATSCTERRPLAQSHTRLSGSRGLGPGHCGLLGLHTDRTLRR